MNLRRALVPLVLATSAVLPSVVHADPLAITLPDPPAGAPAHPDAAERIRLAEAVSGALGHALPDVLTAGESRSRIEVLDPSLLACDSGTCAARIANAMHARTVVVVRMDLTGQTLHLELVAVDAAGRELGRQTDGTTLSDWDDAVALAAVLAQRLAPSLRMPDAARTTTVTHVVVPPPEVPTVHTRSTPRVAESAIGGVLLAGGLVMGVVDTVLVAGGPRCTVPDGAVGMPCSPQDASPSSTVFVDTPNGVAVAGLIGGYAAAVLGAVLLVHGLSATGTVREAPPYHAHHGLRVLGVRFDATPRGGAIGLHGVF